MNDQRTENTTSSGPDPFLEGLKTRWLSLVERYIAENLPGWIASYGEPRAQGMVARFLAGIRSPDYWNDVFPFIAAHRLEIARRYDPAAVPPQAIAELHAFIRQKHADAFR